MKPILRIIIAILCFTSGLTAQDFSYVQFTEKDGLPSDIVYDLCQDKDGFIWFATENGVCRYDGTHFKTFTTADGLPDNAILKVFYSDKGRLWVTPFMYGPYYLSNGRFYPIDIHEDDKVSLTNVIQFTDLDTNLILTVERAGLGHCYIIQDRRMKSVGEVYPGVSKEASMASYGRNRVAVLNGDSIFYKKGNRFLFAGMRPRGSLVTDIDENGNYKTTSLSLSGMYTPATTLLKQKYLFATKDDSVYFFDQSSGQLINTIGLLKTTNGMLDSEDGLWLTTSGLGVFRYPSLSFRHTVFDRNKPGLFSVIGVKGKVLAGDGYSRLMDVKAGKNWADYHKYTKTTGNTPVRTSGLNRVYRLRVDGDDLYVATDAFLIKHKSDGKTQVGAFYPIKDLDMSADKLLICLGGGALLLEKETMKVVDTLIKQRTTSGVFTGPDFYFGTIGGLVKIDGSTKLITKLSNLNPALSRRITTIRKTPDGMVWVLTSGAGMLGLKNDKVIYHITKADGLSSDICTSVFAEKDILWVGTDRGLNKVSLENGRISIIQFSRADGLTTNTVNDVFADSSTVYVAGPLGLNTFSKSYAREKSICILHLVKASVNDTELKPDSVYRLSHNALNIRFDFVGISFKSAGEINYYYKLEGLDRKWNLTTNTYINIATLQPGTYTLRIKAINKFGEESAEKTVKIIVDPPWWRTWWFVGLLIILLAGTVFYLYQRRVSKVIREEQSKRLLQAQFAALEQQALQAQMNPHFIFNCLNSIQSFVIRQDVEGANRYLTGFASLIRQTLDNSSEDLISLSDEIKYIDTYLMLEKARLEDKFVYEVKAETTADMHAFMLPAMLLQPYVENAIRHGIQHRNDNNGEVKVVFSDAGGGRILCRITDNGLGRTRTEELKSRQHIEYMSKGTAITAKRIAMLKLQYGKEIKSTAQDITDEQGRVCGTAIELEFSDFSGITGKP